MSSLQQWCQHQSIKALSINSQTCQVGDCFLAYKTHLCDRRDFIDQAIAAGAGAVIYEAENADPALADLSVPSFAIKNMVDQLAEIAICVYGNASEAVTMIGVTGTNGKSSIVYYLSQALNGLQQKTAMLGTFGNGFIDELKLGANTTPGVVDLYQSLRNYHQRGAQNIAMEVSSHALVEGRVAGISFDIAVFTQLSRDHLDFHGTMQAYQAAKQKLFDWPGLKAAVFNIDDAVGLQWAQAYKDQYAVIATSCSSDMQWDGQCVVLRNYVLANTETRLTIDTPWGVLNTHTMLLGQFNISNLLAVIAVLGWVGVTIDDIATLIPAIKPAPGRMQVFGESKRLVVDYAHTPDALEKALQALRPYTAGELWCVFGCGGDRDAGKRPQMAAVAEQFSDHVIVTDDNPRHENNQAIVADIMVGFTHADAVEVVHDRQQAIESVYQKMQDGDIALIAGKGHEPYQIIGDCKQTFDDRAIANALCQLV